MAGEPIEVLLQPGAFASRGTEFRLQGNQLAQQGRLILRRNLRQVVSDVRALTGLPAVLKLVTQVVDALKYFEGQCAAHDSHSPCHFRRINCSLRSTVRSAIPSWWASSRF